MPEIKVLRGRPPGVSQLKRERLNPEKPVYALPPEPILDPPVAEDKLIGLVTWLDPANYLSLNTMLPTVKFKPQEGFRFNKAAALLFPSKRINLGFNDAGILILAEHPRGFQLKSDKLALLLCNARLAKELEAKGLEAGIYKLIHKEVAGLYLLLKMGG